MACILCCRGEGFLPGFPFSHRACFRVEDYISMRELESAILKPDCLAGGGLRVTASPDGVCRIELFEEGAVPRDKVGPGVVSPSSEILARAFVELRRYFSGEEVTFSTSLDLSGPGTPFQRRVWQALFEIPRGELRTYGELAEQAGSPRAARAVGQAVGQNPLPIIFPCHRVISGDGRLGGFSCGVSLKVRLLELEGLSLEDPARRPSSGARWSVLRMNSR